MFLDLSSILQKQKRKLQQASFLDSPECQQDDDMPGLGCMSRVYSFCLSIRLLVHLFVHTFVHLLVNIYVIVLHLSFKEFIFSKPYDAFGLYLVWW